MMIIKLNRKRFLVTLFCCCAFYFSYFFYASEQRDNEIEFGPKNSYRTWVDEEAIRESQSRVGLGENGAAVHLTDPEEIALNEKLFVETGFSVVVSDHISVNRSLPQVVHPNCSETLYPADLPKVSVIIIFHNEVKSVLLRTVHSVINRTPPELLEEVILVNDNSSNVDLYEPLQKYVKDNFSPKVKIKNLKKRSGLIVARMEGAREAVGEILVFFDSHVEVHFRWLPPLIEPIAKNRRIGTVPITDYFDAYTFGYAQYQASFQGARGAIDWYLDYQELPKLPEDAANDLRMFPNPIMLGCAFAIDRKFFVEELGGYDEEYRIWNGENYELSFKLWMCADGLFTVPCSRVTHSFRSHNPSRDFMDDYVGRNFLRLAEVWLDEYKDIPKQLEPERYAKIDAGDLTLPKSIRKRLKCKSFHWYLHNVAPDMLEKYPPYADPPKFASGSVQSVANPKLCLDNRGQMNGQTLGVDQCGEDSLEPGTNQKFIFSFFHDIRQDHGRHEFCLDSYELSMLTCNYFSFGNQYWRYDQESKEISLDKERCLTLLLAQDDALKLEKCSGEMNQKWNFGYVNETAMKQFDDIFGYKSILGWMNKKLE